MYPYSVTKHIGPALSPIPDVMKSEENLLYYIYYYIVHIYISILC